MDWLKDADSAGFKCVIGNVTLFAVPVNTSRRQGRIVAARGTKWRCGCTHWDAATNTATRYGRDAYTYLQPDSSTAKSLAGLIYRDETALRSIAINKESNK